MGETHGMSEQRHPPPDGFENDADASISQELPVVVLGDSEAVVEPPRRLLQGRVPIRWVLWAMYTLYVLAGTLAAVFANRFGEWHWGPVLAAWGMLYIWAWLYAVGYTYRRGFIKFLSTVAMLVLHPAVAWFCYDRAKPRQRPEGATLVTRDVDAMVELAGTLTLVAFGLFLAHFLFLGRGYRDKKEDT